MILTEEIDIECVGDVHMEGDSVLVDNFRILSDETGEDITRFFSAKQIEALKDQLVKQYFDEAEWEGVDDYYDGLEDEIA